MGIYDTRPWLQHYPSWLAPDLKAPRNNLVQIFKRMSAAMGKAPAIYYFGRSISYAEIDGWSDELAAALQDRGLRKGDRVAFYLQNVPQFAIGQMAVWKAGGIVVPLNPMFKEKELEYFFHDSGARFLISLASLYYPELQDLVRRIDLAAVITTSGLDFFPEEDPIPKILREEKNKRFSGTEDLLDLLNRYDGKAPVMVDVFPDEPAYLTYTSGTTGPPKGAINTHNNIAFNALFYKEALKLNPQDVILGVAPLFHVTGQVAHLAAGFFAGTPLILFYRFDPEEALTLLERWKATMTLGSITVFVALMNHPGMKPSRLATLKKAYSGGAPVSPEIVEEFEKKYGIYIHNIYGLTETSSPTHFTPLGMRAPIDAASSALSIGIPISNTIAKIMDLKTGENEMPPGELGEIVIRGPMVVPGYWNQPQETAHAIRNGWLYTGDVGKMDENGWFYLVDRKKDLVIVSGYKVWPREVENVLYQHPGVQEAAVMGVPDSYQGETVKAYVVLRGNSQGKIRSEEIIEFCKKRLAAYKYPRLVEIVAEIPKTVIRKLGCEV